MEGVGRYYSFGELLQILKLDASGNSICNINRIFNRLKTHEQRMAYAASQVCFVNEDKIIALKDVGGLKSAAESVKFRRLGNEAFNRKDYSSALELYNTAIAHAPYPGQNNNRGFDSSDSHCDEPLLSLALANRSAVLFEIGKYEQCLQDIDFALMMKYPLKFHYKIRTRKIKCLQALGRTDDASKCVQDILKASPLVENVIGVSLGSNVTRAEPELKLSFEASKTIPAFADCVEVKMTEKMGRGLFATENIKTGDIIAIEKPFCSTLFKENVYTYCSHCCKVCATLLPCFHCSLVMFCSVNCLAVSWAKYHKVECKLLPIITHLDISSRSVLSLRTVLVASSLFKTMKEFHNTVKHFHKIHEEFQTNPSFFHKNVEHLEYFQVYKPLMMFDSHYELSHYLQAAYLLLLLDQRSDFFSLFRENNDLSKRDQMKFIACLLLKHQRNFYHSIHSYRLNNVDTSYVFKPIGRAVYPEAINLMNHSCDNNVMSITCSGNHILVRSLKNIEKGEQIFDSYGPTVATCFREGRIKHLSTDHGFICYCIACTENWPLLIDMKHDRFQLKCQFCNVPLPDNDNTLLQSKECFSCHRLIDVLKAEEIERVVDMLLQAGNKIALKDFIQGLDLARRHVSKPFYKITVLEETLKQFFIQDVKKMLQNK